MNEIKVPSYVMRHREGMMNARPNNEGAIADNDHMKTIILELIYIRLLI